ncbi:MAG: hypothetical protein V4488_02820 [Pseudomonadota bacterium]
MPPTNDELMQVIDLAFDKFRGNSEKLKGAIGYLMILRRIGWRPALLMYSQQTIREYDAILNIDSRALFPEIGQSADRSMAWRLSKKVTNFWKAVKGETKGIRTPELE